MIRARVITCSDGVSSGHREDRSGPAVREMLEKSGYEVDALVVVPDDCDAIATAIENSTGDGASSTNPRTDHAPSGRAAQRRDTPARSDMMSHSSHS